MTTTDWIIIVGIISLLIITTPIWSAILPIRRKPCTCGHKGYQHVLFIWDCSMTGCICGGYSVRTET